MAFLLRLDAGTVYRNSPMSVSWTDCAERARELNRFYEKHHDASRWIVDSPSMFSAVICRDRWIWANDLLLQTHGISLADLRRHRVTDFAAPSSIEKMHRRLLLPRDAVEKSPVVRYTINGVKGEFDVVLKTVDSWEADGEPVRHFVGSKVEAAKLYGVIHAATSVLLRDNMEMPIAMAYAETRNELAGRRVAVVYPMATATRLAKDRSRSA